MSTRGVRLRQIYKEAILGTFLDSEVFDVELEVLMVSLRLLTAIDHEDVELFLEGKTIRLEYRGHVLARLSEQVFGVSVRVVASTGLYSSTEELVITVKEPISPTNGPLLARQVIAQLSTVTAQEAKAHT